MKVYYTNTFLEGCFYWRELIPMRAGGWDGDRTSLINPRVHATIATRGIENSDVVVVHRPNDDRHYKLAMELKKQGKKIVFDNDDTYKGFDAVQLGAKLEYVSKWTDEFIKIADLVTCSTEYLKKEYLQLNPNVVVLPNMVDPEDWPDEPKKNTGNKFRIGFIGSVGMNGDFESMKSVIEELDKRDDVQLVLFSLAPKNNPKIVQLYQEEYVFWEGLKNVEWQPFVHMADYINTLDNLRLDLICIPRKDDYFNRCKSNVKFLEASMLEIPVIAQGFSDNMSPYQANPKDAEHMDIILDNSKWLEVIEHHINNHAYGHNKAWRAKQYVLENYDINKNIHLWEEAYGSLLK